MLSKMLGGAVDPAAALEHLRSGGTINITINHAPGKHAGPDDESPLEDSMEAGEEPEDMLPKEPPVAVEEPGMMGAVKRALAPPPKAPSRGVGKGPTNPQTKPGSAKLPAKNAKPSPIKKPPVKKAKAG